MLAENVGANTECFTYVEVKVVLEVAEETPDQSSQVDDMGRLHLVEQLLCRSAIAVWENKIRKTG